MQLPLTAICFTLFSAYATAQYSEIKWYSEHAKDGILIQNSYPKGGPYTAPTDAHFNHSYLVFYARVTNISSQPVELTIGFSADSIPIPCSPNTFMKVILPSDTMTESKHDSFSYGITRLASVNEPTAFQRVLKPKEDCMFYTVAFFYQTKKDAWSEGRGGNRAEYIFDGTDLLFNMLPQVDTRFSGCVTILK